MLFLILLLEELYFYNVYVINKSIWWSKRLQGIIKQSLLYFAWSQLITKLIRLFYTICSCEKIFALFTNKCWKTFSSIIISYYVNINTVWILAAFLKASYLNFTTFCIAAYRGYFTLGFLLSYFILKIIFFS